MNEPYSLQVESTAVGFMSLSTDVNADLLNECFELGPFNGLHKPHPDDEIAPPKTPTPSPLPSQQGMAKIAYPLLYYVYCQFVFNYL